MRVKDVIITLSVIFGVVLPVCSHAYVPKFEEQLVYKLRQFDGKGYTQGFVPQSEETIYFLANKDNALLPIYTAVYFWPITEKYKTSFKRLQQEVQGNLEILRGGRVIQILQRKDYLLLFQKGYMSEISKMHIGAEAHELFGKYKPLLNEFPSRMDEYYKAMRRYKQELLDYAKKLEERNEAGEDLGPQEVQDGMPKKPIKPEKPPLYVTNLQNGFVVNLPEGEYQIRLKARDGTICENSSKKLVVFSHRRKGGIGYEIIPGNRWTKRENSNDPTEIIYAAGENTFYVLPFLETEYRELYYRKMVDPQATGNSEKWIWVHANSIEEVRLLFQLQKGKVREIEKVPYLVKQVPGPELGYRIEPYKRKGKLLERGPSFEGHKITVSPSLASQERHFWLETSDGIRVKNSVRSIDWVKKDKVKLLYAISLFPFLIGVVVYLHRRRATS